MNPRIALSGLVLTLVMGGPVWAHHSFAMFDRTKTVSLDGTVKSLEMINPHSWLQIIVSDAQGHTSEWSLEMGGPGQLQRTGWTKEAVNVGDKVRVDLHPLRDGSNGGQLVSVTLPSGKILGDGRP